MMFQRVWSNLGSSAVKNEQQDQSEVEPVTSEATDQVSDLNTESTTSDTITLPYHPPWMRDITPSGSTRHSRASSIVSTRTKYSTLTLADDARSIDIHVGGQTFRIARDGSHITDAPPPPYTGLPESQLLRDGRPRASSQSSSSIRNLRDPRTTALSFRGGRSGGSSVFDHFFGESEEEDTERGAETPRQHSRAASPQPTPRANILDPSELNMPSPVDGESSQRLSVAADDETPSRNWSYKAGPDIITVAPEARKLRSVSQNDLPLLNSRINPPLTRRNGVRLPTLITESLDDIQRPGSSADIRIAKPRAAQSPPVTRSAGPVLYGGYTDTAPQSPTYIGRNARGIFPAVRKQKKPSLGDSIIPEASTSMRNFSQESDGSEETALPLPMDSENDISLHYARLMRKLDRDHRKAMHLKDKELEKLRERLSEMDTVYRQELKFRDFVIEDLKKRLDHLQEDSENMVEKARNEVEDLWESRWLTQSSKLTERMKRIEEEAQHKIDRLLAEREESEETV